MIYFAQLNTGAIKIGFTNNLGSRLTSLAQHYGHEPALLGTIDGDRQTERELHERFAAHRFGRSEQFRPAPDILAFIGKPLLVDANPQVVEAVDIGKAVRIDRDLASMSRVIADFKGLPLSDYLSGLLRSDIQRDYGRMVVVLKPATAEAK